MTSDKVLSDGQRFAAMLACSGMTLAGLYGLIISYVTVRGLAVERALPLPALLPLGLEGGLVAILAMDLVLTWIGRPITWLRQVARLLAVAVIGVNAAAGLEHGILAVILHALAPALLVTGVEALRHHLLRLVADADELRRQPIPKARWLLAPLSTVAMWRRMVLWQVTSYTAALDADLERREAIYSLRRAYGRRWKRRIPADIAYRLTVGVRLDEAIVRTRRLLAEEHGTRPETTRNADGTQAENGRNNTPETPGTPQLTPRNGRNGDAGTGGLLIPALGDRESARATYLSAVAAGQDMSGADLGRLFGRTDRWGRGVIADARTE